MSINFDTSLLLGWYQAKANLAGLASGGGSASRATAASAAMVPTAPWNARGQTPKDSALISAALSGHAFIDERAAKIDVPKANADYKKLFAINQALITLQALANAANDPKTPSLQLTQLQAAFDRGMTEVKTYVEAGKFDNFRLTQGIATNSETSTAGVATAQDSYTTEPLVTGSADAAVPAFQGAVQFDIQVKKASGLLVTVNLDLSEMGATPRTMNSVASYINGKLAAVGVGAKFSVDRTLTDPETITVGGKPVEVAPGQTQLAFKISGLSNETLTFSAPTTAPAVYVAQIAGNADPDGDAKTEDSDQQQELIKLEAGAGADAVRRPGDQNYVAGRVFSEKLPDGVTNVHATATGADGSVYVLADGSGIVAGQPIKGDSDAVLLKYDSAGALVYARTLGAGGTASGLSLAVDPTGKVAIAGQVTGQLDAGDSGDDPKIADSFVTLFDNQGQELWTKRQGALGSDQAQAVAFDAGGNLFVAGKTQGTIGGGTAVGGWDGYLRAYSATGTVLSTTQFGSVAGDSVAGIVVNGTDVLVAGQDGTAGVVRRFDVTNPQQMTLAATRNLGSLGGGAISGIGLDGAGNVLIGGSTSADLSVATTTLARGGGMDGFGARLSADLTPGGSDAVAYFGGAGSDQAVATVAGGQVWLAGVTKTDLPGLTAIGKQDGFVAALDVGAGAVTYSQRFTAKDQMDAPEAIAVDLGGGSALDRLGLPKGTIQYAGSQLVTAGTAVRDGDQFQIRMGTSRTPITVTISAADTLSSLVTKIQQAGLFGITVQTMNLGGTTTLSLKPASDRQVFELLPGPDGRDALEALGLKPGLVRNTVVDKTRGVIPADRGKQTYGLRFTGAIDLASKADIKTALDSVGNALTTVRAIYADLKQAATPKSANPTASGDISAYMKGRIADYQSALARLTAGQSDSSGSSLASLIG